jgi:hypothetical protein
LGEHLVRTAQINEDDLYQALSLQAEIPWGMPPVEDVDRRATRALPAAASRRWHVLPYCLDSGQLYLLTTEVPGSEMAADLARLSSLEIRFRLVRPRDWERLSAEYLPTPGAA